MHLAVEKGFETASKQSIDGISVEHPAHSTVSMSQRTLLLLPIPSLFLECSLHVLSNLKDCVISNLGAVSFDNIHL